MTSVRLCTSRSRTRCSPCRSSWSSVLMGTKRKFLRVTASAIASGIQVVVLVRLAVALHELPWDQPNLMPLIAQQPSQAVRTAACLHADQRGCQLSAVGQKCLARKLPADDNAAMFVDRD